MRQKNCLLILLFLSTSVFASDEFRHYYFGPSFGASRANLSNRNPQIQYANGTLNDAYPLHTTQETSVISSVNGGYEFGGKGIRPAFAFGLGVYFNPTSYNFRGQLVETPLSDPSNLLYYYKYHINTTRVMAEAQLTWTVGNVTPFINGGIGTTWNHIAGYTETTATSDGYVSLPPSQSHTNANFAYQLGFGIGYSFDFSDEGESDFLKERVSIGYRYAHLGNTSLGTRGAVYPYTLDVGNLQTNDIYLSYTHLF